MGGFCNMIKLVEDNETVTGASVRVERSQGKSYHLRSCEASSLSRSRLPFAFTPLVLLTNLEFSMFSQRQSQRLSTLFKAIQLTVITLRSWQHSSSAKMELTSAVLPVPGVPEMKREDLNGSPEQLASRADAMNFVMVSRSADLPAMVKVPLHVDLSNARTRACMERNATGGIGGDEDAKGK